MEDSVYDLWWMQVTRGVTAVIFGILILVWPGITINVVALMFALLFAVYGVADIITGIQGMSKNFSAILRVLLGILEVGIVVYLLNNAGSGLTLGVMGILMAVNLVVLSVVMIATAFMSGASGGYRWVIGLAGLVTFFVGITVARAPVISIVTVIYVLGVFGLFVGALDIASGLILRSHRPKSA